MLLYEVIGPVNEVENEEGPWEEPSTQSVYGMGVVVVVLGFLVSFRLRVLWEEKER